MKGSAHERGAALMSTIVVVALLIGLFKGGQEAVRMIDTGGSHFAGIVEASADQPDWDKVRKGHLRYAQKALAHGVLAGRAVVSAGGSPSQHLDLPGNLITIGETAAEAYRADGGSAQSPPEQPDAQEGEDASSPGAEPDSEALVCEDGVSWGCDVSSGTASPSPDPSTAAPEDPGGTPTADGSYDFDTAAFARSFPGSVTAARGQIDIDSRSAAPIQGEVTATFIPDTGGATRVETYVFWSDEAPVWDEGSGSWDVALYLQRSNEEPYLHSATIRDGRLTFDYAPFGLTFSFSGT